MTDEQLPDRAERALRNAFAAHAKDEPFQPLAVQGRPRPGWTHFLPAAAAIVILAFAGTTAWQLAQQNQPALSSAGAEAAPDDKGQQPQVDRAPQATYSAQETDGTTAPATGWRLESFGDLVWLVPQDWGYGLAPGPDWCVAAPAAGRPIVDVGVIHRMLTAVPCPRGISPDRLGMHVTYGWTAEGSALPYALPAGWSSAQVVHRWAWVRVVFPDSRRALAERILSTVADVATDPRGCPVRHPIQTERFEEPTSTGARPEPGLVERIDVCEYDVTRTTGPGLIASRTLTGPAARMAASALTSAPVGGGPNAAGCRAGGPGSTAIVLRLSSGRTTTQVYLYYADCTHNGFFDGTRTSAITAAACRPLIGDPVRIPVGYPPATQLCATTPVPSATPAK